MRYSGEKIRISMNVEEFNSHVNDLQAFIEINQDDDSSDEEFIHKASRIKEVLLKYSVIRGWIIQNGKAIISPNLVDVTLFDDEVDFVIRMEGFQVFLKSDFVDYTVFLIEKKIQYLKDRYLQGIQFKEASDKYFKDLPPYEGMVGKSGRKTKKQIAEILGATYSYYKNTIEYMEQGYPNEIKEYEDTFGIVPLP